MSDAAAGVLAPANYRHWATPEQTSAWVHRFRQGSDAHNSSPPSVSSGDHDISIKEAAPPTPVACIDVGEQAHAATPAPNQQHVVVANQNGKLLQRIRTDDAANRFVLGDGVTLNGQLGTSRRVAGSHAG